MTDIVIAADRLSKRYGDTIAVDNVSFDVAAGEIFGVLGPNGAGKTTTILMLLGLCEISSGQARILGHDPARDPLTVKRHVGYMPDSVGFYDNLTALDNLYYTARLIGLPAAERKPRIAAAMARVGLGEVGDKKVGAFSRGMRQRLGLAEILMKDAKIAILDEPTNGLDPQASLELLDLIRSLKASGVTVLLSSHLLDRVQSVCDRVALFQQGRIALIGTIAELGRQVLGGGFAVEIECRGAAGLSQRLAAIPGVRSVSERPAGVFHLLCERDVRPDAAAAAVGAGGKLTRLELERASLEQIYTRYFQNEPAQQVPHAA